LCPSKTVEDWGCSSVAEHLPNIQKAVGSIPGTASKQNSNKNKNKLKPQYPVTQNVTLFGKRSITGNEVKMRLSRWGLNKHDRSLYKQRNFDPETYQHTGRRLGENKDKRLGQCIYKPRNAKD
jgi:hypothetical protein